MTGSRSAIHLSIFFVASSVLAHSDPRGDVCPTVRVENGNFVVYIVNNLPSRQWNRDNSGPSFMDDPVYRVVYSPTGEVLAPRHLRSDFIAKDFYEHSDVNTVRLADETLEFQFPEWPKSGPVRYEVRRKSKTERHQLPWNETATARVVGLFADRDSIGLVVLEDQNLWLYSFVRKGDSKPAKACLGKTSYIWQMPVISNLIKVSGKYCLATVRYNREKQKFETVIATWKPGVDAVIDVLDKPSDWNASLSVAAVNNRICLSYHCSIDGDYPGVGKIITVFRELPAD